MLKSSEGIILLQIANFERDLS